MHITLSGGGTAGHVTPNIALIEELKKADPSLEFSYIGSKNGLEKDLIQAENIPYYAVSTGKLRRYFSLQNFVDLFRIPLGIIQAYRYLARLKPDLVFSKGGFVALPVVLAAHLRRLPIIIHESDSSPGLTTKITARYATEKWSTYKLDGFKQVDLPIRSFLNQGNPATYKHPSKPSLLIMGGSQGADSLNKFVEQNLKKLTQEFQVLHVCGKGKTLKLKESPNDYLSFEYVGKELADLYAAADYVLCRAGASTLAELRALGKKTILVPLPSKQSRGDQLVNAELFVESNSAELLLQDNLNLELFFTRLESLKNKSAIKAAHKTDLLSLFAKYIPSIKNKE